MFNDHLSLLPVIYETIQVKICIKSIKHFIPEDLGSVGNNPTLYLCFIRFYIKIITLKLKGRMTQ
jgi:hypothetical protein